ncbi:hypothetical protein [Microbispora sp. NPDC049633]|uniref:hypothetical protein n=1 Tax=Microbispora sp. NPDC049633 TaxID=3154355 RepID=UPI00343CF771
MFGERQVRILAEEIDRLTDGKLISFNVGGDLGNGTRYFDYKNNKIWIGRGAARQAASFFYMILATITEDLDGYEMPDHVHEAAYNIGAVKVGTDDAEAHYIATKWMKTNRPTLRPFTFEELRKIHGLSEPQALLLTESVDGYGGAHLVYGHAATRRALVTKGLARVHQWRENNTGRERHHVELTERGRDLARALKAAQLVNA